MYSSGFWTLIVRPFDFFLCTSDEGAELFRAATYVILPFLMFVKDNMIDRDS